MKPIKNQLKREEREVAPYGLKDEWNPNFFDIANPLRTAPGPNNWPAARDKKGRDFDYWVTDQGTISILYPVCEAALQWCYKHLPEDCPRWGAVGFAIETNYIGDILERMREDGLLSEDEYVENMNAEERDRHAGENQ